MGVYDLKKKNYSIAVSAAVPATWFNCGGSRYGLLSLYPCQSLGVWSPPAGLLQASLQQSHPLAHPPSAEDPGK